MKNFCIEFCSSLTEMYKIQAVGDGILVEW